VTLTVVSSIHESTANPSTGEEQILLTLIWDLFGYAIRTSEHTFYNFLKAHRV